MRRLQVLFVQDGSALYLSGVVVSRVLRGEGIGRRILAWAKDQAIAHDARALRLDCHAGNPWLRAYCEQAGFKEVGRIEQHPGYVGCLYEIRKAATHVQRLRTGASVATGYVQGLTENQL